MKIFSYGSNMNFSRLKERVPSAVFITIASINNYSLRLNKRSKKDGSAKANIIATDNADDIVWGVIFEILPKEKSKLDIAEGLGYGYNEMTLHFADPKGTVHLAQVYIADPAAIDNTLLPYDWYMEFILSGARQNHLPSQYIDEILSFKYIVDTDEERRSENLTLAGKN